MTDATTMVRVRVEVVSTVSRSKGWARYRLTDAAGAPVMSSSSGNGWLYADHEVELPVGTQLRLTTQVELSTGQGYRRRKELDTAEDGYVVRAGATSSWRHIPGSQGIELRVLGAE